MQVRPELTKLLEAVSSGDPLRVRKEIDQFSSERLDDGFLIVTPLLSSADASLRLVGVEALTGNTTETFLRWLTEHAESDPSAEVRLECLRQVEDISSKDSRNLLLRKATDPDRRVRQIVASGLRHYVDDEVTRVLARFVVDDDVYVQERAIESLASTERRGSSYLMYLLVPLWEGTHWESIVRSRANEQGDRRLVEILTAAFRRDLLEGESSALMASRWMSIVDPEEVLSFVDECLRSGAEEALRQSVQLLSELLRMSAQFGDSRGHVWRRCIDMLRVIAERDERSEAAAEARLLLERYS
jgi:HEAT repeats